MESQLGNNPNHPVQVVPSPGTNPIIPPPPPASTSKFNGKIWALLVVMLLIVGIGVYFAFIKKGPQTMTASQSRFLSPSNQGANASSQLATGQNNFNFLGGQGQSSSTNPAAGSPTTSLPFSCKDLISDAQTQKISGVILNSQTSSPSGIVCWYGFGSTSSGGSLGAYTQLGILSMTNLGITQSYKSFEIGSDIPGVGSQAFEYQMGKIGPPPTLYVVSSNKKYIILPAVMFQTQPGTSKDLAPGSTQTPKDVADSLQAMIDMAKIVDGNLNKY